MAAPRDARDESEEGEVEIEVAKTHNSIYDEYAHVVEAATGHQADFEEDVAALREIMHVQDAFENKLDQHEAAIATFKTHVQEAKESMIQNNSETIDLVERLGQLKQMVVSLNTNSAKTELVVKYAMIAASLNAVINFVARSGLT